MTKHVINNENTEAIKRVIKKYGITQINDKYAVGTATIVNYRKYQNHNEVDIVFEGKIYARINGEDQWLTLDDIKKFGERVSKIKLNRLIKESCLFDVRTRMNYFDVRIYRYTDIKKITWQ
jgi:hypothetical protein